ncbi:gliding motility-associated C-terminal domain-containing protein [Spirosomataceae bacterium TFI 002]|nr:gliding motility-associated C-terminal domain-containing protein [Spirosomataceae bacterium TFI 002]
MEQVIYRHDFCIKLSKLIEMKMKLNLLTTKKVFGRLVTLVLFAISFGAFAQGPPKPAACNVGNGDGFQDLGKIQAILYNCTDLDKASRSIPVSFEDNGKNYTDVKFYFSVPTDFDLNSPSAANEVAGQKVAGRWIANKTLSPGFHYLLASANDNGTKVKSCTWVEVIDISTAPVVDYSICDPTKVEITLKDDPKNSHEKYVIDWGGTGNKETILKSNITLPHTISRPNTGAEVSVTGWYIRSGNELCNSIPSKINPSVANVPYMDHLELTGQGEGALIKFKNFTAGTKYKLEFSQDGGGGGFNWNVSGDISDGSANIAGLDKTKKYCFRIGATDKCGKVSYSPILCSSNLSATQNGSQSVKLAWNRPSEPSTVPIRITMNKTILNCTTGSCTNRPYINVLDVSMLDNGLNCANTYSYQLTYVFKNSEGKDITVISDMVEVDPKGGSVSIKPLDLVTVGFMANDEETIRIVVGRSDGELYNFYRSNAYANDFFSIGSVLDNQIDDISIDPNSNGYCYKYEFEDVCGILSEPSPEFCTVFLSGNASALNWTPYTFPASVVSNSSDVEYTVEFFDNNVKTWVPRFNTKDTSQGIFDIILNSKESQVKFRVQAKQYVTGTVSPGQFIFSYSNTVVINVPPNVFLPSAFTPNGDGTNDRFEVFQKFIKTSTFVVYDRWGAILFETDNPLIQWDGMDNRGTSPVPAGNYAFRIQGESDAGEKFSKTGTITLIR